MEINTISFSKLRNGEHYQFHTKVNNLITTYTPASLGIVDAFAVYQSAMAQESEAILLIRKSSITEQLADKDLERDNLVRGLNYTILGATYHYQDEVKQAANRLKVVIDHFGNIPEKSYDEETAAITNMAQEVTTNHAADVTTVGLLGWLGALTTSNNGFIQLDSSRNAEGAAKTSYRMKESRVLVDNAYGEITKRISSLININGETAYTNFVNELNTEVAKQALILAQRKGRNSSDDTTDTATTTPAT